MAYKIVFSSRAAKKDAPKLKAAKLDRKTKDLIVILKRNPREWSPDYEELIGDKAGQYSRRINYHHRLVYEIEDRTFFDDKGEYYDGLVNVISMWGHYDD